MLTPFVHKQGKLTAVRGPRASYAVAVAFGAVAWAHWARNFIICSIACDYHMLLCMLSNTVSEFLIYVSKLYIGCN